MRKKNYLQLFLVVLIFVLPVVAGSLLYRYHDYFSFKKLNHGVFVQPPIVVENLSVGKIEKGKWRILYVQGVQCDAACSKMEYQLNQLKKALGKDSARVHVMTMKTFPELQNEFINHGERNLYVLNKIYLIDPRNNLFMYYPDSVDPMLILKDMKKVLSVSQIG